MKREADLIRDDLDLQTILICAVRYSLGRATYMPSLVTGWIKEHCKGKLSENTLSVMRSDVDEAQRRNALGMDCDVETWVYFREWLKNEAGELNERMERKCIPHSAMLKL